MKRTGFRFKDDNIHREFMTRVQFDEDSSFQEFVELAVNDYLEEKYNPYKGQKKWKLKAQLNYIIMMIREIGKREVSGMNAVWMSVCRIILQV